MTVDEARRLIHEWVANDSLRGHMEAVPACMGAYAGVLAPDQRDRWVVTGLLHDYDYERHPTAAEHPFVGVHSRRAASTGPDRTPFVTRRVGLRTHDRVRRPISDIADVLSRVVRVGREHAVEVGCVVARYLHRARPN